MKKIIYFNFVLLITILSCNSSKNMSVENIYKGLLFYEKGSEFVTFYPSKKTNLNKYEVIEIIDNNYGNRVWFEDGRHRFVLEDLLRYFDTMNYLIRATPLKYNYTYIKADFNKSIRTKLVDSIFREKAYNYNNIFYDSYDLDDRNLTIDSLIFIDYKINEQYKKLLELHKNSIYPIHPPPKN
jgi:hypothetical protein